MKGGFRAGAGRPPKPVADHQLTGRYRADRHGPTVGNLALTATDGDADAWQPTAEDRAPLGVAGRRFLDELLASYDLTYLEGQRALQAARAHDRLAALVAVDSSTLEPGERVKADRLEIQWRTLLARLVSELGVDK